MTNTETRKPLTSVTWEGVTNGQYLTAAMIEKANLGWDSQSDLAHELAEMSGLPHKWFEIMMSSVGKGLPVRMTYSHGTEVVTQTVIIEYMGNPYHRGGSLQGTFRYHTWGFAGTRWFANIVDVQIPETETVFN